MYAHKQRQRKFLDKVVLRSNNLSNATVRIWRGHHVKYSVQLANLTTHDSTSNIFVDNIINNMAAIFGA